MGLSLGNGLSFVSNGGGASTFSLGGTYGTGFSTPTDGIIASANADEASLYQNFKDNAKGSIVKGSDWFDKNEDIQIQNLFSPDGVQSNTQKVDTLNGDNPLTLFSYSTFDPTAQLKGGQDNPKLNKFSKKSIAYNQLEQAAVYRTDDDKEITLGTRPYSVFNKYSLVNFRGTPLASEGDAGQGASKHYNKVNPDTIINPTASKIIEITNSYPENIGYKYNYADFALGKHFGKRSNNTMITLRRFAFPAPDDIISPKTLDKEGKQVGEAQPDIARAITWMGPDTGNDLANILKFNHNLKWKDVQSDFQTINRADVAAAQAGSFGGAINNASLGSTFRASTLASIAAGESAYDAAVRRANAGFDAFSETYPNHVFGPLNVIDSLVVRDRGLVYNQEFTLKFEYLLKELGGANSKVLMLDQLSNMLALTYNNAPFWGGDYRYVSSGLIGKPLGDLKYIKSGQHFKFISSVIKDFGKTYPGAGSAMSGAGNIIDKVLEGDFKGAGEAISGFGQSAGKALERTLGGGLMKLFNTPQGGYAINAFLSGDPTGQWHVTIGNPLNPMMVMGNLVCTNTEIHFDGPLGPNDFPEKMVVDITLKPGMPRDKAGIESMFNSGKGRFYIQPDGVADINNTYDPSAYGDVDKKGKLKGSGRYTNTFRKIGNG